jgi:hypothetical protein
VAEIHASVSSAAEGFLRGFSHFSQSAFNELTYHFSAQLRKLYYFKSIMNPVAIYHFFKKYFLFVLLSMIKWRFQGRAAVERWQKNFGK